MSKLNVLAMNSVCIYLTWKAKEPKTRSEIAEAMAVTKESIRYPLACLVREGRVLTFGTPYAYYVPGYSGPINGYPQVETKKVEMVEELVRGETVAERVAKAIAIIRKHPQGIPMRDVAKQLHVDRNSLTSNLYMSKERSLIHLDRVRSYAGVLWLWFPGPYFVKPAAFVSEYNGTSDREEHAKDFEH